jgi:hypothetical protein
LLRSGYTEQEANDFIDSPMYIERGRGIYEIRGFNFSVNIDNCKGYFIDQKDRLFDKNGEYFCEYGVCDDVKQVLELCPMLEASRKRKFVISITEIRRDEQPESGGWRWHKWGPYIGTQQPGCEYLYEDTHIESVYVYHIYELS